MEGKRRIFAGILPEEEFVDRRIHKSEYLDPESDSDNDDFEFADRYDAQGRKIKMDISIRSDNLMNKSNREKFITTPGHSAKKSHPGSPMTTFSNKSDFMRIPTSS